MYITDMASIKIKKRKYSHFYPRIRSRHPSHSILRHMNKKLPVLPFKSLIRFGSTTDLGLKRYDVILNSAEAIRNSSSKLRMKRCFDGQNVQTAKWWVYDQGFLEEKTGTTIGVNDLPYPIVAKAHYGSRGEGNTKINNADEMTNWMKGKNLHSYIYEVFHNYAREYRLHVTKDGCFYACRKVLKKDTPDEHKWYRNDKHCNWIREDGDNQELFDKPVNWDSIVENCVKALKSTGLDFGAVDLRIKSSKSGDPNPHFIVIEINSAPSFGDVTVQKYIDILPKLLRDKWKNNKQC